MIQKGLSSTPQGILLNPFLGIKLPEHDYKVFHAAIEEDARKKKFHKLGSQLV